MSSPTDHPLDDLVRAHLRRSVTSDASR
jgi:hypothetical protein